jgi:hypothetical protein
MFIELNWHLVRLAVRLKLLVVEILHENFSLPVLLQLFLIQQRVQSSIATHSGCP